MSSDASLGPVAGILPEDFKRACGRFATGITIATVLDERGTPHGLTVNSFSSVSLEPPLILFCLGHAVSLIETFRTAKYFGINMLSEDQRPLSERFARKGQDRFEGIEWYRGAEGQPMLPDTLAAMECQVENRVTAGDHDIYIGRLLRARIGEGKPLLYFASGYHRLHE